MKSKQFYLLKHNTIRSVKLKVASHMASTRHQLFSVMNKAFCLRSASRTGVPATVLCSGSWPLDMHNPKASHPLLDVDTSSIAICFPSGLFSS